VVAADGNAGNVHAAAAFVETPSAFCNRATPDAADVPVGDAADSNTLAIQGAGVFTASGLLFSSPTRTADVDR
jgi:hypothetical protein